MVPLDLFLQFLRMCREKAKGEEKAKAVVLVEAAKGIRRAILMLPEIVVTSSGHRSRRIQVSGKGHGTDVGPSLLTWTCWGAYYVRSDSVATNATETWGAYHAGAR